MRNSPRLRGRRPGQRIQTLDLSEQTDVVRSLDGGCLTIQGPPGSGKTWTGARLVAALLRDGKRVGVASLSHRAIRNFLEELERVASERGLTFSGVKKSTKGREDSQFLSANIVSKDDLKDCLDPNIDLVAGTRYCFSPEKMDDAVDYLFIDEAGQLSLGDAIAMGTAARNLVLLGDPSSCLMSHTACTRTEPTRRSWNTTWQGMLSSGRPWHLPRAHISHASGPVPIRLAALVRGPAAGR